MYTESRGGFYSFLRRSCKDNVGRKFSFLFPSISGLENGREEETE